MLSKTSSEVRGLEVRWSEGIFLNLNERTYDLIKDDPTSGTLVSVFLVAVEPGLDTGFTEDVLASMRSDEANC